MWKNKTFIIRLVGIVGIGFILRSIHLNSLPVFADEAIYIRWSQVMQAVPSLRFLPLSDGKQPLFMWATIPMFKLFSDPLVAGRILSAAFGAILVAGVMALTYQLTRHKLQTLLVGLLAALTPYLVFFGRMALADTMLAAFLVWTVVFNLKSLQEDRWDWSFVAGFTLGFAWLTKSPAQLAFLLLPLNILLAKWKPRMLLYLATTYVIGFAMYNILRLGPEFHMIALRNRDYVFTISEVFSHPLNPLIGHLKDSWSFYWYLATPFVLILAIWGLISDKFKNWQSKIILLAWWLGPIVGQSLIAKQFTARYLLFTVPFCLILAARGLTQHRQLTWLGTPILVLAFLFLNYLMIFKPHQLPMPRIERSGYLERWTAGTGIKETSEYIKQLAINGPVMVGSEGYFGTPFNALEMYLNNVPNVRVVGVGVDIKTLDEKLTNSLVDNQVVLVVNSTRFLAEPEKLGLRQIASYPKIASPDGSQESLLFFEVLKR